MKNNFANTLNKNSTTIVVLAAVLGALWIAVLGLNSDLYLGDETFHYRLAKYMYESKTRPLFDPLTNFTEEGRIYYVNALLWHTILAASWRLFGGISRLTAQIYQSIYYVILVISTYLLARELYDSRKALYALILIATVPMVAAFSIILHIEIPIAALTTLCLLMLAKKHYFYAGVFLGLSFLTKRNIYLLAPAIAFIAYYHANGKAKQGMKRLIVLFIPLILIIAPDFYFRCKTFPLEFLYAFRANIEPIATYTDTHGEPSYVFYDVASLTFNPACLITYLGVILLVSIGLYLGYRRYSSKDLFLWIPTITYIAFFYYFFRGNLCVRYLSPLLAPLAIIGSVGFSTIKSKWITYILITGCVLQFVSASLYTYSNRIIPIGLKNAYAFINTHTPQDARIMCTKNALALHTDRISMWSSYASLVELPYLFWRADKSEMLDILDRYKVNYILIEKDRIYDDSEIRHLGGYPKSFVERIPSLNSMKLVFENEAVSLWKVQS